MPAQDDETKAATDAAATVADVATLKADLDAQVALNATQATQLALAQSLASTLQSVLKSAGYTVTGVAPSLTISPALQPASAPAAPPTPPIVPVATKPRLGVHDQSGWDGVTDPTSKANIINLATSIHATVHRTALKWNVCQPKAGTTFDFSTPLAIAKASAAAKLRKIFCVQQSPSWATGLTNVYDVPPLGPAFTTFLTGPWEAFCTAMATALKGLADDYEILNESNMPYTGFVKPDPVRYAQMCCVATKAILAADPSVRVLVGGMCGGNAQPGAPAGTGPSIKGTDFLTQAYAAAKAFAGVATAIGTGVSFHPYGSTGADPSTPTTVGQSEFSDIALIYAIMQANGHGAAPLVLTEFGGFGANTPAYLPKAVSLLQSKYPYVTDACYFQLQASPQYPGSAPFNQDGTADKTGVHDAFVAAAESLGQ